MIHSDRGSKLGWPKVSIGGIAVEIFHKTDKYKYKKMRNQSRLIRAINSVELGWPKVSIGRTAEAPASTCTASPQLKLLLTTAMDDSDDSIDVLWSLLSLNLC